MFVGIYIQDLVRIRAVNKGQTAGSYGVRCVCMPNMLLLITYYWQAHILVQGSGSIDTETVLGNPGDGTTFAFALGLTGWGSDVEIRP